LGIPP